MIQPSRIVGAGLAGLLAAYSWPNIPILEAASASEIGKGSHKALLRFRSDAVSRLTGIPFRQVTVRKGIWYRGEFRPPSIRLANDYAQKATGRLVGDRSIWNLEPVTRYVAPESFYNHLLEYADGRIQWGKPDDFEYGREQPIISTVPLPIVMAAHDLPPLTLHRAAIRVTRYRIAACDLFQTVYFPDPKIGLYRASITGDTMIMERAAGSEPIQLEDDAIRLAFGVDFDRMQFIDHTEQKYGKIIPLAAEVRKAVLFKLTHDHGIYSLGRFATWRNILLDDVVDDIAVIRRLLQSDDKYDVARLRAND